MIPNINTPDELRQLIADKRRNSERFHELLPSITTKDGLVSTSSLIEDGEHFRLRSDKSVKVFPHYLIETIVRRIQTNDKLWGAAALRVEPNQPTVGRAPIFGVSFKRAIEETLNKGEAKTVFFIPPENYEEDQFYAKLFVRLSQRNESNGKCLIVEAWEWIGKGIEVFYAHMILSADSYIVSHIDCAVTKFDSESSISEIFATGNKKKGISYKKFIRLDGALSLEDSISLITGFFPIEELVDEYFCAYEGWPSRTP